MPLYGASRLRAAELPLPVCEIGRPLECLREPSRGRAGRLQRQRKSKFRLGRLVETAGAPLNPCVPVKVASASDGKLWGLPRRHRRDGYQEISTPISLGPRGYSGRSDCRSPVFTFP